MKILRHGKYKCFVGRCLNCLCEFAADINEIYVFEEPTANIGFSHITYRKANCPDCGSMTSVEPSEDDYEQIKEQPIDRL